MAKGDTKTNQYLDIAANGTRADFPESCCETRSQTLIREVGERIMDLEDEVERLENNPDVADIVATYADLQSYDTSQLTDKDVIRVLQDETHDGDSTYYRWSTATNTWTYIGESKQYTDFVGTDGTTAGAAGLVPAPAATDAGKFLKADGTWDTAGGGGGTGAVVELTTADYDVTIGATQGIALWRLGAGLYHTANDVQAFAGDGSSFKLSLNSHLIIIDDSGNQKLIKVIGDDFTSAVNGVYKGFVQYKVAASDGSGEFTQSESVVSTASLMISRGFAPTSSNVGFRGQLWYDSANNKLYVNVNRPTDYAGNWKEISLV